MEQREDQKSNAVEVGSGDLNIPRWMELKLSNNGANWKRV